MAVAYASLTQIIKVQFYHKFLVWVII